MSDPVTIGAFVVSVLTKAAEAGLGEAAKGAAKDAYEALKNKASQWAGREVVALEDAPDSPKRQNAVVEILDRQPEQELEALRVLARELIAELKKSGDPSVGLILRDLENATVHLKQTKAEDGAIGAVVEGAKGGSYTFDQVEARGRSGN